MKLDWKKLGDLKITANWKTMVLVALGVLFAADLLLAGAIWKMSAVSPQSARLERDRLKAESKLLDADVARAERIKADLADVGKKCDDFYKDELPDSDTGYSQIEMDLGSIAQKAGLKTSLVGYHQKAVKDRGVIEVQITAAVDGDYENLVKFINGIERSRNFYLLDSLTLASGGTGTSIKLNLTVRTFFRS
jgi:Tfp pilus assembly protein PilO